MGQISVLVVDDHAVFADALGCRLAREPDLHPVIVAYRPDDAFAKAALIRPAVVVLDLDLGDRRTGIDIADALRGSSPRTRTIILTGTESPSEVMTGLRVGVRAWVNKTIGVDQLVRVIRGVEAGEGWLAPVLLGRVLDEIATPETAPQAVALAMLTVREREVLQAMLDGASRAEVATRLRISTNTVRTHVQNLFAKLGAHSTLELLAIARRRGMRATAEPVELERFA
jgi:DNA-binding NarL/FixJ family response regulator